MALIKCKECGNDVSKKAKTCPNCGAPVGPKQYGCGTLIIVCLVALFIIGIFFNDNESTPTRTKPSSNIHNEEYASSNDAKQARAFLADLPPACSNSSAYARTDGTVVISINCRSTDNSMDSTVEIKDGIVNEIR
jgi:hypothetical protein